MTDVADAGNTVRKAQCAQCMGARKCDVRGHFRNVHTEAGFSAQKDWFLLQCRGCDYVFAQTEATTSEDYREYYDEDNELQYESISSFDYWPALSAREKPEWMSEYGIVERNDIELLDEALIELYGALNANLPMLSAIGIRTTFDVAAVLLSVEESLSFSRKLDALVQQSHLREAEKGALEMVVDAGSASAHRGWKPTASDLTTMMTILENFIFEAFVQPARRAKLHDEAAKVRRTVPPRISSKKKVLGLPKGALPAS